MSQTRTIAPFRLRVASSLTPVNAATRAPVNAAIAEGAAPKPATKPVSPGSGAITQSFELSPRHAHGTVKLLTKQGGQDVWYKCAPLIDPRKPPHREEDSWDKNRYLAMESQSRFKCVPQSPSGFSGAASRRSGHMYVHQTITMIIDVYKPYNKKHGTTTMIMFEDFELDNAGKMIEMDPHLAVAPWPKFCRIEIQVSGLLHLRDVSRKGSGAPPGKPFLFYGSAQFAKAPGLRASPAGLPLADHADDEGEFDIVDYHSFSGGYNYRYSIVHCLLIPGVVPVYINDPVPDAGGGTPSGGEGGGGTPTEPGGSGEPPTPAGGGGGAPPATAPGGGAGLDPEEIERRIRAGL